MAEENVGIWIRVSTGIQAKGDSPEIHKERARMYSKVKNWNVKTVYSA
jgi:site-specific DNA recombinase